MLKSSVAHLSDAGLLKLSLAESETHIDRDEIRGSKPLRWRPSLHFLSFFLSFARFFFGSISMSHSDAVLPTDIPNDKPTDRRAN